jgi:glutamate/tyrosine decarboxylase-like PLP-dependent enzyme
MENNISGKLSSWNDAQLERFLRLRQELFLDPLGSNRKRFEESAVLLQRALFGWYFSMPGKFPGLLSWIQQHADETRQLRKEELLTIRERRFSLHVPAPEIPAVESGVSENQWQKIFGSFNTSYEAQRLFERFLIELDEYTNPSLRFNHRYLGELLPHDNMVSYFAAIAATFLNENAVIGKVSPCVAHMEQASIIRLTQLVGWEGKLEVDEPEEPESRFALPLQRLPTPYPPAQNSELWQREQPTGTIVGDGTIANISALLIARNATFNYLLGWGEAVQSLGPDICWRIISKVYGYERMVVITSKGAHYSVPKAAHIAGIGPLDVIEVAGSDNPWELDGQALERTLKEIKKEGDSDAEKKTLLLAVVAIAGKTETGYIDNIEEVAKVLEKYGHPTLNEIWSKQTKPAAEDSSASDSANDVREDGGDNDKNKKTAGSEQVYINDEIEEYAKNRLTERTYQEFRKFRKKMLTESYRGARNNREYFRNIDARSKIQVKDASYNRPFLHVDAAHGGAFLTVPYLRNKEFRGIHLADTVTLDGHKMFYCYYPCGGLLIRTTRWARTLHIGHSTYISEDTSHEAYGEDRWYLDGWKDAKYRKYNKSSEPEGGVEPAESNDTNAQNSGELRDSPDEMPWVYPELPLGPNEMARLSAAHRLNDRPAATASSELRYLPFTTALEGSRGSQGIMQMYFNLSTIGFDGYRSLLEWTYLLSSRCAEAVSLGRVYVRPVTEEKLPSEEWMGNAKDWAIQDWAIQDSATEQIASGDKKRRIVPVLGGRLLRLSAGSCNQLLVSYVPQKIAMLISSQGEKYWTDPPDDTNNDARPGSTRFWQTMHYLWRVNEHLWVKYLYANPAFTYYVGHTEFEPILPNKGDGDSERKEAKKGLENLLCDWNIWARWRFSKKDAPKDNVTDWECPFFKVLADVVQSSNEAYSTDKGLNRYREGLVRFFAHKIVVMHPYTDESILSDLLGKMMFWGERSAEAVQAADAACQDWLLARK